MNELGHEQMKSRNLLLNIFPSKIVDVLRNSGPKVIADQLEDVSILFADLVGFSGTVATMAPKDIIVFLNRIFSTMDELSEQYKMEKIKTIGDCYMAVAGAPEPVEDHAHAAARMALDIHKYAEAYQLQFRIGINTGPVIAGIIGFKKFSYDLWGDSVNIASRLESEAKPGTTLISSSTYDYIKEEFKCTPLGSKDLKGIGKTTVWQLEGPLKP